MVSLATLLNAVTHHPLLEAPLGCKSPVAPSLLGYPRASRGSVRDVPVTSLLVNPSPPSSLSPSLRAPRLLMNPSPGPPPLAESPSLSVPVPHPASSLQRRGSPRRVHSGSLQAWHLTVCNYVQSLICVSAPACDVTTVRVPHLSHDAGLLPRKISCR